MQQVRWSPVHPPMQPVSRSADSNSHLEASYEASLLIKSIKFSSRGQASSWPQTLETAAASQHSPTTQLVASFFLLDDIMTFKKPSGHILFKKDSAQECWHEQVSRRVGASCLHAPDPSWPHVFVPPLASSNTRHRLLHLLGP